MNNALPILYSFRRCPYAMRARLAIASANIKCELREVLLRDKPSAMLEASAKGEVPVLVLAGGEVLDESRDIIFWALAECDPQNWLADFGEREQALLAEFDGAFKHNLDRYKYASRYDDADVAANRAACVEILARLEPQLGGGWLGGDKAGLIDIAVLPFVRQFRIANPAWFDDELALPNTQNWLAQFLAWDLFKSVMQKYPQWTADAESVYFPQ